MAGVADGTAGTPLEFTLVFNALLVIYEAPLVKLAPPSITSGQPSLSESKSK